MAAHVRKHHKSGAAFLRLSAEIVDIHQPIILDLHKHGHGAHGVDGTGHWC